MKRITFLVLTYAWLTIHLFVSPPRAEFQEETLQISLKRNWGYSSGTGRIQGTFTIRASGPENMAQVVFYMNDQVLGEVNEAPFSLRFITDDYPLGVHILHATGSTSAGAELQSNEIRVQFVSSEEGWRVAGSIIVPLVVIILVAVALATLVPFIFSRGKKKSLAPGAARNYGYFGGAICPKCDRPFSRHIYGLNLGTRKFDRCPYCGKWSLVGRASIEELETAEAAEVEAAQKGVFQPQLSEDEELRRDIEDSRFDNL